MSDDDLLAKATRELRDAGDPPLPELRQTRRRIIEAAGRAEKPSRRWVWLVGQLAAFLLAATALAATTGQLQPMIDAVREVLVGAPAELPAPARETAPRGVRRSAPSVAVESPLAEVATAPALPETAGDVPTELDPSAPLTHAGAAASAPEAPASEALPPGTARRPPDSEAIAAVSPAEPEAPLPANDPDLELYREAHRAHFVRRDSRAALEAWDRYLAAYPRGNFALEARYNRALCLVRLGRHDAARQALAPFAAGEVAGGYRRTEASALLEALDAR